MVMAAEEQLNVYPQLSAPADGVALPSLPQYPEVWNFSF